MSTEQKFNCIFCKDVFESKEELQFHFRKHADPKFKSKNRFEVDSQVTNEKDKDKAEQVSCDVCSKMFPTISKAITHKHKVHPDHDVKYFCPWCGKLFTMKHPYNIHIQTSHDKQEQIEDKIFHCDCCDVDFFLPSAMTYHNKFFHRQDTDIPEVGTSKKLRLYNQEVLQLYYCSFCGEEFENKVNLFKHITDEHGDENQSPEEVLRCPLCEAIFFHLDAYEIHLSFHSTEDLYSANNELFADLLDFSLETVPPIIEKVETREDFYMEGQSQDTEEDPESTAVGIEQFLKLAMDQSEDDIPVKVKKKKRKKSKKAAAITLDEFLSMNQDVFGEGLDFQGVEELPTRVVKKKNKKKKATNAVALAELEKLQQKGIVVMKVGASKPTKVTKKKINKATTNRELKTSSDVLTKLINQSNNQIKIVKNKTLSKKSDTGRPLQHAKDIPVASEQNVNETESQHKGGCKEAAEHFELEMNCTNPEDLSIEETGKISSLKTDTPSAKPDVSDEKKGNYLQGKETTDNDMVKKSNFTSNSIRKSESTTRLTIPDYSQNLIKTKDNTKSISTVNEERVNQHQLEDRREKESDDLDKVNVRVTENIELSDKAIDKVEGSYIMDSIHINNTVGSSLSSLKHLSHLTVKPINKNKPAEINTDKFLEPNKDRKSPVKSHKEPLQVIDSSDNEINSVPPKQIEKDHLKDALTFLSKNITIKPMSMPTKVNVGKTDSEIEDETDLITQKPNIKIKPKVTNTGNKSILLKNIKIEKDDSSHDSNMVNVQNTTLKHVQKVVNRVTPEMKTTKTAINSSHNSPVKANTNILMNLPNITTKTLTVKKNEQSHDTKQNNATVKTIETFKEADIIEISDIDDSDDETDNQPESTQNIVKPVDPLKNLSKHITVKPMNQPVHPIKKVIKVEKTDDQSDDPDQTELNFDNDMPTNTNVKPVNPLKNLSKHITVKSMNQPVQPMKKIKEIEKTEDQSDDPDQTAFNFDYGMPTNTNVKPVNPLKNLSKHITVKSMNQPVQHIKKVIEVEKTDNQSDDPDQTAFNFSNDMSTNTNVNPLKNLSKHITVKSANLPVHPRKKIIKVEKPDDQSNNPDKTAFNFDYDMITNTKVCSQKLSSKNIAFKNALKNLGKNITVKSRTSSPHDHNSQGSAVGSANEDASDSDSDTGKVKITEIENDKINHDDNLNCDNFYLDPNENYPIVESPNESCSDNDGIPNTANEYCSDNDGILNTDFESEIQATTVQKTKHEVTTNVNTNCLNNLKNISKSITIKSVNMNSTNKQEKVKPPHSQESTDVMKKQSLAIAVPQQTHSNSTTSNNRSVKQLGKIVDHTLNESCNQKEVSVNKEVMVKTFQSKTVIQEITTTVTKTIKTVNQTVNKQETRNSSQINIPVLPQRVQGMKPSTSKNLQGVVIRHAAPSTIKPNTVGSQVTPAGTVVRPSKQIVPMRPGVNMRPVVNAPRMPNIKNNLPKSSPKKQVIGKPLKFSPSVVTSTVVKRPNAEEVSGPFSCFKKPKESLIPVSDVPAFSSGGESSVQVNAASHTSTSNYTSTSKIVKGKSVVTATQTKSEQTSMQQMSRISNSVGIKVRSAQIMQTQVQEKNESGGMKRTTLEAIERLQKQGLLVKKPRIEEANDSSVADHLDYSSADENAD